MNVTKKRIEELINEINNTSVLIIGDVMLDSYMWGNVNRISPEAPIPIVAINNKEFRLGGAANVALNIKAMGAKPILCSVVGDDSYAEIFKNILTQQNLSNLGIIHEKIRKTTVKTRIISGGQHILRVDEEDTKQISNKSTNVLAKKIKELIIQKNVKLIIFEDYDKGVISAELIEMVKTFARTNNIVISVDPKKQNFNNYTGINLFKPNFKEFCEGLKIDINKRQIKKIAEEAHAFIINNKIDTLLITLSEQGVFICNKNGWKHFAAEIRDISDVSGAGDTVISVASLFYLAGADIKEIAMIANYAGGLVCEKPGVVPVDINDLLNEFD